MVDWIEIRDFEIRHSNRDSREQLDAGRDDCNLSSGKGAVFQHACYRCQHACYTPNMHVRKKAHVNMVAEFSMMLQNSTLMFRKGRCCGGQGRQPMAASINTSLFAPSKKSPHGLHHLLGYDRLPSPQTSWAYPAWPRTPDSDKPHVPCVAAIRKKHVKTSHHTKFWSHQKMVLSHHFWCEHSFISTHLFDHTVWCLITPFGTWFGDHHVWWNCILLITPQDLLITP